MFFQHEFDLELNLDQPVNYTLLLSVISKLSIFALHTSDYAIRKERMAQTTRIMYALCNIDQKNNRETLHYICNEIYENGEAIAQTTGDMAQLHFAKGFKVALYILDSKGMKFSDDWKNALVTKLNETRAMIRDKAKSIEKKLKKDQVQIEPGFF